MTISKPLKLFHVSLAGSGGVLHEVITAASVDSDSNGVHFFDADHYLTATYPVGTMAVSADALKPPPAPAMESAVTSMVSGNLVAMPADPRIKIGTVNITVTAALSPRPSVRCWQA